MAAASRPRMLPHRERGVRLAMTLAQQQQEEASLAYALRLVRKYENKIQESINARAVRAALGKDSKREQRRPRGPRKPEEHQVSCLSEVEASKKPRTEVKNVQDAVVHKLQKALKRHHLRKRARAQWTMRCHRDEFLGLFGGHAKIQQHSRSGKMYVVFGGKDTAAVNALLGPILSIGEADKYWYCRRFYGENHKKDRDCAYIAVDEKHEKRKEIVFGYKEEHTAHKDRRGRRKLTTMGVMFCKFPRSVATVKPLKKYRKKK